MADALRQQGGISWEPSPVLISRLEGRRRMWSIVPWRRQGVVPGASCQGASCKERRARVSCGAALSAHWVEKRLRPSWGAGILAARAPRHTQHRLC